MNVNELIEMLSKLTDEEKEMLTLAYDDMDMGLIEIFNYKIEDGYIILKNM